MNVKEDLLKQAMREMGSRGGKRRLETMSPEQRTAVASAAAKKSAQVRSNKADAKKRRAAEEYKPV